MQRCQDENSAINATLQLIEIVRKFIGDPSQSDCWPPCKRVYFKYDLKYFHKNSWPSFQGIISVENHFNLYYFYDTLQIEEKVETLIFDLGGLLAAAGGNLGLCLGFSCLSVLHSIVPLLYQLWKKIKFNYLNQTSNWCK